MLWHSDLQATMKPRRQELWQRIIEATLQVMSEKGYPALTVNDITERARISRTQFYFLFQDKE